MLCVRSLMSTDSSHDKLRLTKDYFGWRNTNEGIMMSFFILDKTGIRVATKHPTIIMPQDEPFTSTTSTTTTTRSQAGSFTMATRPTRALVLSAESSSCAAAHQAVLQCGGNVQLLEARICELTQSIRALQRSNDILQQALTTAAEGDDDDDPDFVQALHENRHAIVRQGSTAQALVREMQARVGGGGARRGVVVDLEPDIGLIVAAVQLELTTAAKAAPAAAADATNQTTAKDQETNVSEGLYL